MTHGLDELLFNGQNDIVSAELVGEEVHVRLADGRRLFVPLAWLPPVATATPAARANIKNLAVMLYWPDIDEGLSLQTLLLGQPPA